MSQSEIASLPDNSGSMANNICQTPARLLLHQEALALFSKAGKHSSPKTKLRVRVLNNLFKKRVCISLRKELKKKALSTPTEIALPVIVNGLPPGFAGSPVSMADMVNKSA